MMPLILIEGVGIWKNWDDCTIQNHWKSSVEWVAIEIYIAKLMKDQFTIEVLKYIYVICLNQEKKCEAIYG